LANHSAPPITAADLVRELQRKGALPKTPGVVMNFNEDDVVYAITANHLSTAIVPSTRPPLTFSAAYAHIFQRDLEGRPVRKGRRG
jgi:hypothetical protein